MGLPTRRASTSRRSTVGWLMAAALLVSCTNRAASSPDPAIAASGFPIGTYTKSFVEPTFGPSTLAWTFGADGRWAEIPLEGAPVGAKPIRGTFHVDGDVLTIVTDYPPGFGTSRHTWRIEGGNLWTTYRSSDFAEDEGWFAMLDPVPWAPMP